jgi:hypothetical protein
MDMGAELEIIEALECIRKWIPAGPYAATVRAKMGVISVSQTRLYSQFSLWTKRTSSIQF